MISQKTSIIEHKTKVKKKNKKGNRVSSYKPKDRDGLSWGP